MLDLDIELTTRGSQGYFIAKKVIQLINAVSKVVKYVRTRMVLDGD